uniref:GST N-terminal domain-containing protein n=1 Tax=Chenopodium quinoa TaxID=63459 RepID=A0A803L2U8_CHEQI
MPGALNFTPISIFRPNSGRKMPINSFRIRASTEISESTVDSSSQGGLNAGVSTSNPNFSPPPNFKPPEPKRFGIRPDRTLDILGASLSLIFRLGTGVFADGYSVSLVSKDEIPSDQYALEIAGFKLKERSKLGPRPENPIEIYEFESLLQLIGILTNYFAPLASPYVACNTLSTSVVPSAEREIVAVLDLDVLYYPCPRNGPNFRPKAVQMGGKKMFPYMVDPNTGVSMYESDDIIKYLVNKYGNGQVPLLLSLGLLTTLTEGFAMIGRMGRGSSYTPAKMPPKPLVLWAYEGSPFCKVAREVLVELELPHIQRSCARGSPKRQDLYARVGHFQVPYLEDPNTGVQMFESAEIVDYLKATYAL